MPRDAAIITFYSYKGGVGRSFALANVASFLARWGYKVLCVDFDLEAPGLNWYFARWISRTKRPGLVELVQAFSKPGKVQWRNHITPIALPSAERRLYFMSAGLRDSHYVDRAQGIDWVRLYDNADLGIKFETMREEWKREFDFVLIDSRTGVTDIGGICTVHLPDIVALVVSANDQSVAGAKEVATRAIKARSSLPFERANLQAIPIPSRFDLREEYELGQEWLNRFANELAEFYPNWLAKGLEPKMLLQYTQIPYFSFWSFGEKLPAVDEKSRGPESITYHLETIAALLAHRLARTDLLVQNRDYFVRSARRGFARREKAPPTKSDLYLSFSESDRTYALELARWITQMGLKVHAESSDVRVGRNWYSHLSRVYENLPRSSFYVTLLGERVSPFHLDQIYGFLRTSLDSRSATPRLIPVVTSSGALRQMPTVLRQFQFLDARGLSPRVAAHKVVATIRLSGGRRRRQSALSRPSLREFAEEPVGVEKITKNEFDSFGIVRGSAGGIFGREEEWYATASRRVLGVVIRDSVDRDWNVVTLARDEAGLFRAVETKVSFKDRAEARDTLFRQMIEVEVTGSMPFSFPDSFELGSAEAQKKRPRSRSQAVRPRRKKSARK